MEWWHGLLIFFFLIVVVEPLMSWALKVPIDAIQFLGALPILALSIASPWLIARIRTYLKRKPFPEKR